LVCFPFPPPSNCLLTVYLVLESENFRGYDHKKEVFNQEVELTHAIEVDQTEAEKFKYKHSDKCDIWAASDEQWFVKFKKGA
jgi:fatty acid synthase subunit alpha